MQNVTQPQLSLRHFQPSDLGFIITLVLGNLEEASQKLGVFFLPFPPASLGEWGEAYIRQCLPKKKIGFHKFSRKPSAGGTTQHPEVTERAVFQ